MVEAITYTLRDNQLRSDQYYRDIAVFTDEVLAEAKQRVAPLVETFQTYLEQTGRETLRSFAEYAFEVLTLGVLWRIYANETTGLTQAAQGLLVRLTRWREQYQFLKPIIDLPRGLLATFFLFPFPPRTRQTLRPTLENLNHLLSWLAATGDFKEEVKRLGTWRDYLANDPPEVVAKKLKLAFSFASWFETQSRARLGRYTPHVERFLNETHPGYRWREDVIFCGRRRVEYHLNMVGTEILNRSFRELFLKTDRKIVLLPPCMKAKPKNECEAETTPFGERCAACTPNCRVHQATRLGEKHGFTVLIMPHELSVFSNEKMRSAAEIKMGVVGVSCPLTNVTGGWETKELGVPAQGVLLDYCGCPWHWHPEGIPTDINFDQLLQVLDLKNSR